MARHLPPESRNDGFDTLILADLLFNHSEHGKLVLTVTSALKKCPDAVALVFFTPYRPWLLQKDLAFFELAEARGLIVTKMYEQVLDEVMFPNDPGVNVAQSAERSGILTGDRTNDFDGPCMATKSDGEMPLMDKDS